MARVHSRELKLEVCRQIAAGVKRPAQICREHQLANSLLAHWRQEYAQRCDAAFPPARSWGARPRSPHRRTGTGL